MITQTYKIDLIPSGEPVVVHVSQYDNGGRTLAFELYNGGVAWEIPAGSTASITGTKPDGTGFMYVMTVSGNTASLDIEEQMAILPGDVPAEIRISSGSGIIGTANFIIRVEKAALDEETAISETDIPVFEQLVQQAQTAATNAQTAETEAGNAADAAEDARDAIQALIPSGGTTGQYLQKTASGTQWAEVDALPAGGTAGQVLTKQSSTDGDADWEDVTGGGDLAVTFTYSNGTATADKTYAELAACIAAGGTPYGLYGTSVYRLSIYSSTAITFSQTQGGGYIQNFSISSSDAVTYNASAAYTLLNVTLLATNWVGNVYTHSSASIPAPAYGNVTVTMPDQSTESAMEAAIAEYAEYDLYAFNQVAGAISFYARGTVPTENVQLVLIIERRY